MQSPHYLVNRTVQVDSDLSGLPKTSLEPLAAAIDRARMLGFPGCSLAVHMREQKELGSVLLSLLRCIDLKCRPPESSTSEFSALSEREKNTFASIARHLSCGEVGLPLLVWVDTRGNVILQPREGATDHSGLADDRTTVPLWDSARRELRLGTTLVRRYRRHAPHQERILDAFQQSGWPACIHNPLSNRCSYDEQLHDAIKRLNRHQDQQVLCFKGDGSGKGVLWEQVSKSVVTVKTVAAVSDIRHIGN